MNQQRPDAQRTVFDVPDRFALICVCLGLGLALIAACEPGPPSEDPPTGDPGVAPDAAVEETSPDAAPVACALPRDMNPPEAITTPANRGLSTGDLGLVAPLLPQPNDTILDQLVLELLPGWGVFEHGLTTGDFSIAGAEQSYATCGLCVRIAGDTPVELSPTPDQWYMATEGTIHVTSIDTSLQVTFEDVRLEHVTIAPGTFQTQPTNSGCATRIDSLTIDSLIE
jgi:hypothetical protein